MAIECRHKTKTAKAVMVFRECGAIAALRPHLPDLT
jgi:hypothetical protein